MSEIEKVFDALDIQKKELIDRFFEVTPKDILESMSEESLSFLVYFYMDDEKNYLMYIKEMIKYYQYRSSYERK